MRVKFLSCEDPVPEGDFVVVIDVISAFTTAAWLFEQKAEKIIVAETADQARALKVEEASRVLVGEDRGKPIEGFDYPNDLTQFSGIDFSGRACVMKTSAGTRGLMANIGARYLLAASLCNARATANFIRAAGPEALTFIITNNFKSAEDLACAAYICDHLFNENCPNPASYCNLVDGSRYANDTRENDTGELEHILKVDRFDFVMICSSGNGPLTISPLQLGID